MSGGRAPVWRAVLALLLCLGAAACASVPTGGRVDSGRSAERTEPVDDPYVRLVPAPPGRDWDPDDIVRGFLVASASFDDGHKVAREYLTPPAAEQWRPDGRPRVIVHGGDQEPVPEKISGDDDKSEVRVPYDRVATIGVDGQYLAEPQASLSMDFEVVKDARGQWRIGTLPEELRQGLLLGQRDVDRAFRIMHLYFFEPDRKVLVPNGVFLPLINRDELATALVRALLNGPTTWLRPAVYTAIPEGTALQGRVSIADGLATVNLSAQAFRGNRSLMSAQLVWTLTRLEEIKRVRILIDGEPLEVEETTVQSPDNWADYDPDQRGNDQAMLRGAGDTPHWLLDDHTDRVPALASTRLYQPAIGLYPSRFVAGLSKDHDAVYTGDITTGQVREVLRSRQGGHFTTPSWDRRNTLWTVETAGGKSTLWMLPNGANPTRVDHWQLTYQEVRALRVARDGVRVAAIVADGKSNQLQLGRIERLADGSTSMSVFLPVSSELDDVRDLAWADSNTLAVLGKTNPDSTQVTPYRVPVSGGAIQTIGTGTLGEPQSIAAAPGAPILVGVKEESNKICYQVKPREWYSQWDCEPTGAEPTYPG